MTTVRIVTATLDREFDLSEVWESRTGEPLPERVTETQVRELSVWYADVSASEARPLKAKLLASSGNWMVQEIGSFGLALCICGHHKSNHTAAGCNVRLPDGTMCACQGYQEDTGELEPA